MISTKETGDGLLAGMEERVGEHRQAHAALPAKIRELQAENAKLKKVLDAAMRTIDVATAALAAPSTSRLIRGENGRVTGSVVETH